jgi:fructan beta-fructosidase
MSIQSSFVLCGVRAAAIALACVSTAVPATAQAQATANASARVYIYDEPLRPQFHFTARRNWLNDPNGLVYYQGKYHLFFQHNPFDIEWGNMTWGHAVSDDLVHWRQLDDALQPDALGTIFSGSAVVDWNNTAGFQKGREPALVAMYTAAGGTSPASQGAKFTQCLAYSNDGGRNWTKYQGNPVLPHIVGENRDPKVVWHEPTRRWVMALYLDKNDFALFTSPDLKQWERVDEIKVPGSIECPDLFELPVVGKRDVTKWIFWTANNVYLVGEFDGRDFKPIGEPQRFEHGANCFAAQTYSDIPADDGRRIQIAWMRGGRYPGMPFNQQMTFPTSLALHETADGYRLRAQPVAELEQLRGDKFQWSGELDDAVNPLERLNGSTYEMSLSAAPGDADRVVLDIRGSELVYHVSNQELSFGESRAHVPLVEGKLALRILVDRSSVEVFANDGSATLSNCFVPHAGQPSFRMTGAGAKVDALTVWPLKSAWRSQAVGQGSR